MSRPVVLLTGFEPFGGAITNPSWLAVEKVKTRWKGEADLHIARLPTTFRDSGERLDALVSLLRPSVVIATGVAQGRATVTPEVIAINRIDARIPDNSGAQPQEAPVVAGAPDGLFSTLPVKSIVAAMRAAGVPSGLSYSAGSFVCNAAFYALMHALKAYDGAVVGGFIHVPATPELIGDADCPSMSVDLIASGLEAAVLACLTAPAPARLDLGTIA